MVIRVAATLLKKVDFLEDALTACRLCLKELHSMPAVQSTFAVEFKRGFWARFSKSERSEIIFIVYRLNRVIYDVTQTVCCYDDKRLLNWPCVDHGKDQVDVLRDLRVVESLRKQDMERYWAPVTWSFGQEGEKWEKLVAPVGIATNTEGQFIVADRLKGVMVFDCTGGYVHSLDTSSEIIVRHHSIYDIATDENENIYVLMDLQSKKPISDLFELEEFEGKMDRVWLFCFAKTGDLHFHFHLREGAFRSLAVSDNNKVLVLRRGLVDVFTSDGQFVRSFGKDVLSNAVDITAANDGRVMVLDNGGTLVLVFSENGDYLFMFQLGTSCKCSVIAFSRLKEHVLVADDKNVLFYTERGDFVGSIKHYAKEIHGITVSNGRIVVACTDHSGKSKIQIV